MHPATKSGPSPSRIRDFWAWIALCAMTLLVYEPTLRSGFIWDDDAHVTKSALQSLHGLWRIWFQLGSTQQYYPVLFSAFWVEHRLWGDAALGYHLTNVILHGTSAWLFARVLRRLWDGPSASPGPVGSAGVDRSLWRGTEWLAATIFALHPVAVESVAWISEQKNTLSTVFYLLATLTYLRFDERRGRGAASSWAAASLLFVLALLSKTVTATLPAALLVIFWWQRGHLSWRRDVRPLIPWFAAATAAGLFTAWVERKFIGAQGVAFDLTLGQRCLLAGRVIWFYLGKLVWPAHLIFVYPRWDVNSAAAAWAGYLAAALAVTAALWRLRRRWRGPLAAWLFFVGSLFPALGFFNVYPFLFSYVADHFQYLASLGIIAAA